MKVRGDRAGADRLDCQRRGQQIEACREELEREYVTAVDDNGEPKFASAVPERARTKTNQIAARKIRPYAQLRVWWKTNAILSSGVASDVITSLSEHARAAAVDVTGPCS